MYIIRETFTAKPGMASKLAKLFKEMVAADPKMKGTRVLTDAVGPYNTVVMEMETRSLSEFEEAMKEYAADDTMKEKMKGYTEMYVSGKREIYQVV